MTMSVSRHRPTRGLRHEWADSYEALITLNPLGGVQLTEFVYGKIDHLGSGIGKYAVMTQEIPWSLVRERIGGTPASVVMV
jgi:hypothetical protein